MKPITKLTAIILVIFGLCNLIRIYLDIHMEFYGVSTWVGHKKIPMSISVIGAIIAFLLSIGLWRESMKKS